VEQDIREHIEEEYHAAPGPVGLRDLAQVLHRLGSPDQWVPREDLSWWRRFLLRLRMGPDDWRLAYLAFGILLAGFLAGPLFLLFLLASFCASRAVLAVAESRHEELGAQKWLIYPSLILVYGVALLVVLAWPFALSILLVEGLRSFRPLGFQVFAIVSIIPVWWLIVSAVLFKWPGLARIIFHPWASWFRRRNAGILFAIAVVLAVVSLSVWLVAELRALPQPEEISLNATSDDGVNPLPIGNLIDVGGRKLHLYCLGSGGPNVVLIGGSGGFAVDWGLVQSAAAQTTQVCAYDRAGYAWSDTSPGFEQVEPTVEDLRHLLVSAAIKPPYVLVGHSFGGVLARMCQRRYPLEVGGVVLVDSTADEDFQVLKQGKPVRMVDMSAQELREALAHPFAPGTPPPPQSIPRAPDKIEPPFDKLPLASQRGHLWALQQFFSKMGTIKSEERLLIMESARATFVTLRETRRKQESPLGDIPLIVLSRSKDTSAEYNQMQKSLTRLSRNSKYVVATTSGHLIHLDQPEIVINAIREVVEAARERKKLGN